MIVIFWPTCGTEGVDHPGNIDIPADSSTVGATVMEFGPFGWALGGFRYWYLQGNLLHLNGSHVQQGCKFSAV